MADHGRAGGRGVGGRRRPPGRVRRGRTSPPARRAGHRGRRQRHRGQVAAAAASTARAAARRTGQHVLHDQRSACHHRRHVFPELCVHIAHHDVRALLHGPVASQEVTFDSIDIVIDNITAVNRFERINNVLKFKRHKNLSSA